MSQKFSMRLATPLDADAIANLYLASRKAYISFAPLAHSDDDIREWVKNSLIPNIHVWIIEQDNIVLGMMAISEKQGMHWIEQLYVLPKSTGQGIGSLLMEKAKSFNIPIRLRTFQENWGARRFYDRHGFTIIEFSDGSENEKHCPDMVYEWNP